MSSDAQIKTTFLQHTLSCMKTDMVFTTLTLYVLSDEGVVHDVTVICFQDFLKFSDVIVLVGAGRKKKTKTDSVVTLYTLCLCDGHGNVQPGLLSYKRSEVYVNYSHISL